MKLLILYGTTEGQTRKIAHFVEDVAQERECIVTLCDSANELFNPNGFDAVIIASSIHMGKYQAAVAEFAKKYATQLNKMPSAFLSVSLTAVSDDKKSWEELYEITDHFLKHCDWKPTQTLQVAGALKYMEYDFLKKMVMRLIAQKAGGSADTKRDHEYTQWDEIQTFVKDFTNLKATA
jgi:menaquinone-dependent protoporphyrinogen oxidase